MFPQPTPVHNYHVSTQYNGPLYCLHVGFTPVLMLRASTFWRTFGTFIQIVHQDATSMHRDATSILLCHQGIYHIMLSYFAISAAWYARKWSVPA